MALKIGLNQARSRTLLPLYIRNQYSPKRALDAILAKVGGGINQRLFYADYRQIKNRFNWAGALAKLSPEEVVPQRYFHVRREPHVSRYVFRFEVQYKDRDTGELSAGHLSYATDERIDPATAFQAILDRSLMLNPQRVEGSRRARDIASFSLNEAIEYKPPRKKKGQ